MDWWNPQQAGIVGALLGGVVGGVLLGGIGGGVCGPLAARGRARRFVLLYFGVLGVLGLVLTGMGVYALAVGQPFHVWFWLVQPGVIVGGLCAILIPALRTAYRRHEQRILDAEELRRG